MKKLFYLSIVFVGLSVCQSLDANAQGVGINSSGNNPDPSALLDLNAAPSNNKGFLIPRLTTAQRDAIVNPALALQIYNTTTNCFEYWANGIWQTMTCATCPTPAQPSSITGNASPCEGSSQTYSVTNVNGATYTWTFPSGWTQTAGGTTNSVTVTVGAGSGNIQVVPSNTCGSGTAQTLAVTPIAIPAAPTAGTQTPSATQIVWNWNTVSGATGYKYNTTNDYSSATDNSTSTSYTQTGLTCNTPYTLYAWAYNTCGNSTELVLNTSTSPCIVSPHTFSFTGAVQTFTVPSGVSNVNIQALGASGGVKTCLRAGADGKGGKVLTNLSVISGSVLFIYVGGAGGSTSVSTGGIGGFNGGGDGGSNTQKSGQYGGSGGGGASDIRQGGNALSNRVIVAGGGAGGGGAGADCNISYSGGDGGNGGSTTTSGSNGGNGGNGGGGATQSAGGSGGSQDGAIGVQAVGGTGGSNTIYYNTGMGGGGGGGGGYYGGGGGGHAFSQGVDGGGGGGGGGSSYAGPGTSGTTFTNAYNTGDGQVIISW